MKNIFLFLTVFSAVAAFDIHAMEEKVDQSDEKFVVRTPSWEQKTLSMSTDRPQLTFSVSVLSVVDGKLLSLDGDDVIIIDNTKHLAPEFILVPLEKESPNYNYYSAKGKIIALSKDSLAPRVIV